MAFRELHRTVKIRLGEQFVSMLVGNMIWPFMVIYFSDRFGPTVTGLVFVFNIGLAFVAGLYGGHFSDLYGRRQLLIRAYSVRFLAMSVMAAASSPWWDAPVVVFVMMSVSWCANGIAGPAGDAMLVDVTTPENRKFVYSIEYWFWNIAGFVGAIAGSFLFETHRFELLGAVAGMALVTVGLLVFFIEETYVPKRQEAAGAEVAGKGQHVFAKLVSNYRVVVQDRVFGLFFLAVVCVLAVQFQSQNYTAVRMAQEVPAQTLFTIGSWSPVVEGLKLYGLLNSVNTVLVIVLGLWMTRAVKRLGDRRSLTIGIALNAAGYAALATFDQAWLLFGMIAMLTVGELLTIPVKQAMLAELVPDDKRGSYMAVYRLSFRAASVLGSLSVTLGAILPSWGIGAEMLLLGGAAIWLFGAIHARRHAAGGRDAALAGIASQTSQA